MTKPAPNADELQSLIDLVCDDAPSKENAKRLEELLQDNPDARQFYLTCIRLDAYLRWECKNQTAKPIERRPAVIAAPLASLKNPVGWLASDWSVAYLIAAVICGVGLAIAAFTYVSQPTDIAQHFNHSNPQPLIANPSPKATIVARITGAADCRWERKRLGIRDLGLEEGPRSKDQGSRPKVQKPMTNEQVPIAKSPNSNPQSLIPNPSLTTRSNPEIPKSLVCLGDQFILSAGLMEITYNTGAKVILQGPCTFEVDSAAGGYLEIGKLTARVEQSTKYGVRSTEQVASGEWLVASDKMQNEKCKFQNAKLSNAKSPNLQIPKSPNPQIPKSLNPLFAIRTPTATITDLGTEFGVEVDQHGNTASHVFEGSVELQTIDANDRRPGETFRLSQNESIRIEKNADTQGAWTAGVRRGDIPPKTFVRALPGGKKTSHAQVAAHFRLGEDDLDAAAGKPVAEASVDKLRQHKLKRSGSPTYVADTVAPGSSMAMGFRASEEDYLSSSEWFSYIPTDNFILEAWARFNQLAHENEVVAYFGDTAKNGYGIMVRDGNWAFLYGGATSEGAVYADSGVPCESGKWTHLALVCHQGQTQLWIDGQPAGKVHDGIPIPADPLFMIGGNLLRSECFDGLIDEVRLTLLSGSFKPEMFLLRENRDPDRRQ